MHFWWKTALTRFLTRPVPLLTDRAHRDAYFRHKLEILENSRSPGKLLEKINLPIIAPGIYLVHDNKKLHPGKEILIQCRVSRLNGFFSLILCDDATLAFNNDTHTKNCSGLRKIALNHESFLNFFTYFNCLGTRTLFAKVRLVRTRNRVSV